MATISKLITAISRIIQITALRNPGGYSAPNVAIHIYGCVLIGSRPKQDGVRSVF